MNKKKVLLVVLAMVLVCALSVMTTMALLTQNGGSVTNTFVASIVDPDTFVTNFEIKEYKVGPDAAGNYDYVDSEGNKLTEGAAKVEVAENSYTVTPGVTLPKDAFVKLSRTNETPAYLFIKVVNTLDADVFTMNVDTKVWTQVNVPGVTDGTIYVLSADGASDAPTILGAVDAADGVYHIIDGNKVTVADENDLKITKDTADTIEFYAYICQATVAKADGTNTSIPAEVFDICF